MKDKNKPDMNILISSTARVGVSWVARIISLVYEQIYGKLNRWTLRISRLRAGHPAYPMQDGWCTCEYVPLRDLLRKRPPHQKIILLQRDLESLRHALFLYFFPKAVYEEDKDKPEYWKFFKRLEEYYNKIYENIEASNVLRVRLEDLNNYTVATFHEIFDFLGFPREGRPILIPVNPPERTWQVFSSVLNKGQKINKKIEYIYKKYNDTPLEYVEQGNPTFLTGSTMSEKPAFRTNGRLRIELAIQGAWKWVIRPNKLNCPDPLNVLRKIPTMCRTMNEVKNYNPKLHKKQKIKEETIKEIKKEEIKEKKSHVVIIGSVPNLQGCHFSEHLEREFKELNWDVTTLPIKKIFSDMEVSDRMKYHINWILSQRNKGFEIITPTKEFSLKKVMDFYKLSPDLIFIDESRFRFINDTGHIVFFNKKAWYSPGAVVKKADTVFMKTDYYIELNKGKTDCEMFPLPPSVHLGTYFPSGKPEVDVVGIGYRASWEIWERVIKSIEGYIFILNLIKTENEVFKKCGYRYFDTPVTDKRYRRILKGTKILWFSVPYKQYITRRMLEAMACKTLCVFRLDNEEHEKYLEKLGFIDRVHYIGLKSVEEIPKINDILDTINIDTIIDKAYNLVINKHTHKNRTKTIINRYNQIVKDKVDVIVPTYNHNEKLLEFIDNWFEELPIRKLFLGQGKDPIEIPDNYKHRAQITIIDQTHYRTLGKCITELMSKAKTKWFVFLHSDVKLIKGTFNIMKKEMSPTIGELEARDTILFRHDRNGVLRKKHLIRDKGTKRAYSGFQIFRTEIMKDIINKMGDDYVYRNEDLIFQNVVTSQGYEYKKVKLLYEHYNEGGYIKKENDVHGVFLGLIKYTTPTGITKGMARSNIIYYDKKFKPIDIGYLLKFMNKYNSDWIDAFKNLIQAFKNKYRT